MAIVLADTSVWSRSRGSATIAGVLADAVEANTLAVTPALVLELLRSARSPEELRRQAWMFASLHQIPLNEAVVLRATVVQRELADSSQHRGPSVVDLLSAAAAQLAGAELWHCDKHFEQIAGLTGQPARRLCG